MIAQCDYEKQDFKVSIIAEFDENNVFSPSYLRNNSRKMDGTPVKNMRCFPACSQMGSGVHRSQVFCGRPILVSFTSAVLDEDIDAYFHLHNAIFIGEFVPTSKEVAGNGSLTDINYYDEGDFARICTVSGGHHTFSGKVTSPTTTIDRSGVTMTSVKVLFNEEHKAYSYNIPGSRWSDTAHVFRVAILMKYQKGYKRVGYCSSSEFKILSSRRNTISKLAKFSDLMTRCVSCHSSRPCLTSSQQCRCGLPIFSHSYANIVTISISSRVNPPISCLNKMFEAHKLFMCASTFIRCETAPVLIEDWCTSFSGGHVEEHDWDVTSNDLEY